MSASTARVCSKWVGLVLVVCAGGCLSPATLRPVAEQNSENLSNFTSNVALASAALKREAQLHAELEVQVARNSMSALLIKIPQQMANPTPTEADLANPQLEPHKGLLEQLEGARSTIAAAEPEAREAVIADMVREHPLIGDVILDTPGFSITRVLADGFKLRDVNSQYVNATNAANRNALMAKRNGILDAYAPVRAERQVADDYLAALQELLDALVDQATIARSHADAILAFAKAQPQLETIGQAVTDTELQQQVVDLVRKRKGEKAAARVEDYVKKAGDVFSIIEGLGKK